MKKEVTPYLFEKYLILSLDNKWNRVFDGELSFKVFVNKQRKLCIVSKQCLRK